MIYVGDKVYFNLSFLVNKGFLPTCYTLRHITPSTIGVRFIFQPDFYGPNLLLTLDELSNIHEIFNTQPQKAKIC